MSSTDFKICSEKCVICVRLFKWFPVIIIASLVAWSYYAFVVQLCIITVSSFIEEIFYLILYHVVFAMFIWSYWQTIFTPIGVVPKQFKLPPGEIERLERDQNEFNKTLEAFAKNLPVYCRSLNRSVRFCEKCYIIKPDRAHHCSVCGVCVLKMDHHCPWVNNCVNFTNYKFFILFLGYSLLYCLFISATSLKYFIKFWTNNLEGTARFHILFLFFFSVMFAISLISLLGYHFFLVSVNRSTLESFRPPIFASGPEKDGFNIGHQGNFQEVFGEDKMKWFIPVHSSRGDGISFPKKTVDEVTGSLLDERRNWMEEESDDTGKIAFGKIYESDNDNNEVNSSKPLGQLRT